MGGVKLSAAAQAEVWAARDRGEALSRVARRLGVWPETARALVNARGGIRPVPPKRAEGALTPGEREEISRGLAAAESFRRIGARLGRAHTTVAREVAHNGGRAHYRAGGAERAARRRAPRPEPAKPGA